MVVEVMPSATTEAVAGLLRREPDERPATEDLVWEAKEEAGHLDGFPGLPAGHDYRPDIGNMIRDGVSPLPAWFPMQVASPDDPTRVVLVVKVPRAARTPHVHRQTGHVYFRSARGTNDPIKDQANLNRLVAEGREGKQHGKGR